MPEIVITSKGNKFFSLEELWKYRDLFYFLAVRDIKVKYRQTFIGVAWAIVQPLATMIIFTVFFNKFAGISSGKVPYVLFSYLGLMFWNFFSINLSDVSNSLITNGSIITKVYFPKIIAPLSAVVVGMVDFVFSSIIFFVLMIYFKMFPNVIDVLVIAACATISSLFVVGLGSFLAVINVKYRDVRYVLPFFIQLFLFLTPIIYPINAVPKKISWILYFNPLTGVLDLVRGVVFGTFYNPQFIFISVVSALLLTIFGLFWFSRYIKDVADII